MKKLFSLILITGLLFFAPDVNAQIATGVPSINQLSDGVAGLDSVTNTTGVNQSKVVKASTYRIAIQANAEKVSGTVSLIGILQSTCDGTNWVNHFGTSADSFTVANTSGGQSKIFSVGTSDGARTGFRMKWTPGAGATQKVAVQSIIRYLD